MRNFESHTREIIDIVRDVIIFHCYSLLSAQIRVAYKLASQEYLGCTRDQPMPGPFPAPPIFWGKSPGDEVGRIFAELNIIFFLNLPINVHYPRWT